MDIEDIVIWVSRVSLVVWTGVLAWCIIAIVLRAKKEKEWLEHYVPTLESDIEETEIRSWSTLTELEVFREEEEQAREKRRARKRKAPGRDDE